MDTSKLQRILDSRSLGRVLTVGQLGEQVWRVRTTHGGFVVVEFEGYPSGNRTPWREVLLKAGLALEDSAAPLPTARLTSAGEAVNASHVAGRYYIALHGRDVAPVGC